jgi:CDP-ribitol ribitolphosphotransferase
VREVYALAFGTEKSKVIALGSPRLDYLLAGENRQKLLEGFYSRYPGCRGKKLVLYAPTFRDNPRDDAEILSHIDAPAFAQSLGDEYALLVKLHPQVHCCIPAKGITDVTALDIGELALICDILITDYSSVCMDFAVLGKPCVFYAYDLEKYESERSFCFGYKDYVPGEIVTDFSSLAPAVKNPRSAEKLTRFRDFNFDYIDTRNSERIFDYIMNSDSRK